MRLPSPVITFSDISINLVFVLGQSGKCVTTFGESRNILIFEDSYFYYFPLDLLTR